MDNRTALKDAIAEAGGQAALASLLGVSQSLVSFWLRQAKRGVSPEFAPRIEAATGVSRHDLRPDVFGPKPQSERAVA